MDMKLIKFLCSEPEGYYSSFFEKNFLITLEDFIGIASQLKAIKDGYLK